MELTPIQCWILVGAIFSTVMAGGMFGVSFQQVHASKILFQVFASILTAIAVALWVLLFGGCGRDNDVPVDNSYIEEP
jgi:hypothetical protein